ncbi:MAG: UDP-N-acetylglucosamine 2-epimerase (non-hydrolyzing) [Planctomycetota bacterium]|nr:UDP-N-acetylglucosamine 2-epimerase (non-hydrolyzing) [Planctomycetota bacterium]MDA1180197.1 UDP-N-acetylglucosamine 2-epimerase (non-hydrolyzing) [Planctomycetota bacterium]
MLKPLLVFGTRPEAIKMAPIVAACKDRPQDIAAKICLTGQHREMLQQVTDYFGIQSDINLDLMKPNQSLAELTAACIERMDTVLVREQPDCVVVQGDTTTVFATSIAAFYRRLPVVHVEAGLRTGNIWAPWPEELNRRITSLVTAIHCAPTPQAADQLRKEGYAESTIHVTGNTVIDALLWTVKRERARGSEWRKKYDFLGDQRMILITGHRRENFGDGFRNICQSIRTLAERLPDVAFLYPVHLNPNVQGPVHELLGTLPHVYLVDPAPYPEFVWLMDRSTMILSDSGGVQEEAPSLKKPLLVMRDTTERPEAVAAGAVELVGTSVEKITERTMAIMTDSAEYQKHQVDKNPYGDGSAAPRIVELMLQQGWQK